MVKGMDSKSVAMLMELDIQKKKENVNKYKNNAIYQAKSMEWIGKEYPYLDDKEENTNTDVNTSTDKEIDETDSTYTTTNNDNKNTNNSSNYNTSNSNNTNQQNQTSYATVPNLVGLNYDVALSKMSECKITQDWNPEYIYTSKASKNNTIAEQSLEVGSEVEEWTSIDLKIYKYSDNATVRMPLYVVGKNVNIEEMARTRNSN